MFKVFRDGLVEGFEKSLGRVKYYDQNKNYGYIIPEESNKELFFRGRDVEHGWLSSRGGDIVAYRKESGEKGPRARDVELVKKRRCPLCRAEKKTEWYHEDDVCWSAKCKSCGKPMIVLKRHDKKPTKKEKQHMKKIMKKIFGPDAEFRGKMRKIKDHYHEHVVGDISKYYESRTDGLIWR